MTPWRFSLRVCLAHLRGFALRKELGLLRPSGGCRKARLCWLLLGTLPKLVSTCEDIGEGAPESVRWQTTSWSDLAKNGPLERVPPEGRLGWLLLHVRIWLRAGALLVKFFPLLLLYPMAALAQAAPVSLLSFWNLQANEPIGHLKKLEKGSHIPVLGLRALCHARA